MKTLDIESISAANEDEIKLIRNSVDTLDAIRISAYVNELSQELSVLANGAKLHFLAQLLDLVTLESSMADEMRNKSQ